jgi:hypothetical protein
LAIIASVLFSVFLSLSRSRVGTHDLWYDDAWVALARRASLSRAIHMGASAPGFSIVMRWWTGLVPGSVAWAQSFALVPLLFAPFVVFAATRTAGASRTAATVVACLSALSPMLLRESARVKQYTWEYALSAVLVAIAAAVHRDGPRMRLTILAACVVVVGVAFSFALLIPTALLSVVFAVALLREARTTEHRFDLRAIAARLAVLGSAAVVVLAWARAFLLDPPRPLLDHWQNTFLGSGGSLSHTARQAVVMLRGFWGAFIYRGSSVAVVIPVVAVAWFAWRRWRTEWWLLLAVPLAIALSATHRYPLGSIVLARVDAWLIPWIAVIVAITLTDFAALPVVHRVVGRVPMRARIVAVGVVAILLCAGVARDAKGYVPMRAQVAVGMLTRAADAAMLTYVAEDDWPVDLLLPGRIRIVTDHNSETNFSVVLDGQPRTLHFRDIQLAAGELRDACGHSATIVGVSRAALRPILRSVGCPLAAEHSTTNGTPLAHDDIVTVTLATVQ